MTEYETREKLIQIIESHAGGLGCEYSCARGYERCENCEFLADDILRSFVLLDVDSAKALMNGVHNVINEVRRMQEDCYADEAIMEHLISKYGMEVEE